MTKLEIFLYLLGGCGFIYIGMWIENRRLEKRYQEDRIWEFRRGVEWGKNHLPRVLKERTERDSAMQLLDLPNEYFNKPPFDWEKAELSDIARRANRS